MCYNAPASLGAFIGGVTVSLSIMTYALSQDRTSLAILSGGWIWVICMQLWEYMIWKQYAIEASSRLAYIFNIMQIPFLYFLFVCTTTIPSNRLILASILLIIYLCVQLWDTTDDHIRVTCQDSHLHYPWWNSSWKSSMYFIGLLFMFLLLVRPFYWSLACVATLFIMLLISKGLYSNQSVPSLWCFFAVSFPVFALLWSFVLPR